jgi:hypothetical protein
MYYSIRYKGHHWRGLRYKEKNLLEQFIKRDIEDMVGDSLRTTNYRGVGFFVVGFMCSPMTGIDVFGKP